jgi:predicted nucleotide-binding protein
LNSKFNLTPLVLSDLPTVGTTTIIEKFEKYANNCKHAIGLLTPDDIVENGQSYRQPRPNVIFELGWFVSKLSRNNVLLIIKEGTEIFSDLQGVLTEMVFKDSITEIYYKLEQELGAQKLISASESPSSSKAADTNERHNI